MIDAKMTLELQKNGIQKTVHCMSGESEARRLIITLTNNGKVFDPASYDAVAIFETETGTIGCRADVASGEIELILPTLEPGEYIFELAIGDESSTMFSPFFRVIAEQSFDVPADGEEPEVAYKIIIVGENNYLNKDEAEAFCRKDETYSIEETDELLKDKADVDNIYSKAQVDNALGAKANVSDVYAKADTYNKTELDAKLDIAGGFVPIKLSSGDDTNHYMLDGITVDEIKNHIKSGNGLALYADDSGYIYEPVVDVDIGIESVNLYSCYSSGAIYKYYISDSGVTRMLHKDLADGLSAEYKRKLDNLPAQVQAKLTAGTGISIDPYTNEIACTVTGGDGGGTTNITTTVTMSPLVSNYRDIITKWYDGELVRVGNAILCGWQYGVPYGDGGAIVLKVMGYVNGVAGVHNVYYDMANLNSLGSEVVYSFDDIGKISTALAEIRTIINGGNS